MSQPVNLVFIVLDQRVDKLLAAAGYSLPAMDALASRGVTFQNHYISSAMCTASRASFFTGQHPHHTGVTDQMYYSFVRSLDPKMPNMGSVLKAMDYKTAYFGKFELDKDILAAESTVNYSDAIQSYGFDVFSAGGDIGSGPYSGFDNDPFIVGEAVRGLHGMAEEARRTGRPFFMVTSLVNPHDIMYGNANVSGEEVQQAVDPSLMPPPPSDSIYEKKWNFTLPESVGESLAAAGMPPALAEYKKGWDAWTGGIPADRPDMWTMFYNYYLNAIADVDRSLQKIVDVMDEMDLWRDTAIVFTADHGEMGGAHGGLKGKGPFAYEQNIHVPLIITHPQAKAGATCSALTSHIDLLPTFVGLSGVPDEKHPESVNSLPGRDFSALVTKPNVANAAAARDGILFNYISPGTIDAGFLLKTIGGVLKNQPTPPLSEANLNKRGFLSVAFDGRYKFGRFFAPAACNTPQTLDEILDNNDVQLFDLTNDPGETRNLALEPEKNQAQILRMNALLNELLEKEIGPNHRALLEKTLSS
jgi:arylsulfatase